MSLYGQQLEFAISPWPLLSDFFHWLGLFRGDLLAVVPESWIVRPPVSRERIQQLQRRCPAKGSEARGLHSIQYVPADLANPTSQCMPTKT